jgi:hypothetical protein
MFRMVASERRRFEALADHVLRGARQDLGGAAIQVVEDLVATGELAVDHPARAAGQLLGMLDHATLVLGLTAGDEAQPDPPAGGDLRRRGGDVPGAVRARSRAPAWCAPPEPNGLG